VVDGVGLPSTACVHDVAWYARRLAEAVVAALVHRPLLPLRDGLAGAIGSVRDNHTRICAATGFDASAAVGIVRVGVGTVEMLSLADVAVVVERGTDLRVCLGSTEPAWVAQKLSGHSIGTVGHRRAVEELLRERATRCNRDGGFYVASADPSVVRHARVDVVSRQSTRRVAVFSDGAHWPVGRLPSHDWRAHLRLVDRLGGEGLLQWVRQLEADDAQGLQFPRLKQHDDATVVYADLGQGDPGRARVA
jgi:hypothetical protein